MATVGATNPDPLMVHPEPEALRTLNSHQHASAIADEKGHETTVTSKSMNSSTDDDGFESDGKSWHEGVLRARAIATVWSRKTMWSMFAL